MSYHIVLFLKQNTNINFEELVKKIEESYKEVGKGIIVNKNTNNQNYPNFIFEQNKELIIDGNNHHITINILGEYTKIKTDIIEMLWDAFDYNELEFKRIGHITELTMDLNDIKSLKSKLFNKKILEDIDEFQFSFHNLIKFQRKNINCWKRYIKFISSPLFISYDINTKENIEINYKTVKQFIEFSEKFTNEDINKFIKER